MTPTPTLAAQMSEAERLEQVRETFGVATLKEFHHELTEHRDYSVSYEALRNYHRGDRTPPAQYLWQVSEAFKVRLAWLVAGDGEMTVTEQIRKEKREADQESNESSEDMKGPHAIMRVVEDASVAIMGRTNQAAFIDLVLRVGISCTSTGEGNVEEMGEIAQHLAELVTRPSWILNPEPVSPAEEKGEMDYQAAMILALKMAVPPPRQGGTTRKELIERMKEA